MNSKANRMAIFSTIAISVLLASQAIGYWINNNITQNTTLEINSLIHFTHIRNFGGVFGMFQGSGGGVRSNWPEPTRRCYSLSGNE